MIQYSRWWIPILLATGLIEVSSVEIVFEGHQSTLRFQLPGTTFMLTVPPSKPGGGSLR